MSRFFVAALVLAVVPCLAAGETLLLVNNSRLLPGTSSLLQLDTDTKDLKVVSSSLNGYYDWVSSSVVCDNVLYGTADDIPLYTALGAVDLSTGKSTIVKSPGNIHAVGCGRGAGIVYGLVSESAGSKGLLWSLYEFNTKSTSGNATRLALLDLGSFSFKGSDAAFRFVDEKNELWIATAIGGYNANTGNVFVVDVPTGAPKAQYSLPSNGWPYLITPTGESNFGIGLMTGEGVSGDLTFYTGSANGGSISISGGIGASDIYNGGMPPAVCNGVAYQVSIPPYYSDDDKNPAQQYLLGYDATTGAQKVKIALADIAPMADIGAVACAP